VEKKQTSGFGSFFCGVRLRWVLNNAENWALSGPHRLHITKQLACSPMSIHSHYLVYLHAAIKHSRDCLMAEVMEGEVIYISSMPELVPRLTKGHAVTGKGRLGALDSFVIASSLNGTHLDEPFLVMGKKTVFWARSICSQRKPSISPRLIAVSIAKTMIGHM